MRKRRRTRLDWRWRLRDNRDRVDANLPNRITIRPTGEESAVGCYPFLKLAECAPCDVVGRSLQHHLLDQSVEKLFLLVLFGGHRAVGRTRCAEQCFAEGERAHVFVFAKSQVATVL